MMPNASSASAGSRRWAPYPPPTPYYPLNPVLTWLPYGWARPTAHTRRLAITPASLLAALKAATPSTLRAAAAVTTAATVEDGDSELPIAFAEVANVSPAAPFLYMELLCKYSLEVSESLKRNEVTSGYVKVPNFNVAPCSVAPPANPTASRSLTPDTTCYLSPSSRGSSSSSLDSLAASIAESVQEDQLETPKISPCDAQEPPPIDALPAPMPSPPRLSSVSLFNGSSAGSNAATSFLENLSQSMPYAKDARYCHQEGGIELLSRAAVLVSSVNDAAPKHAHKRKCSGDEPITYDSVLVLPMPKSARLSLAHA